MTAHPGVQPDRKLETEHGRPRALSRHDQGRRSSHTSESNPNTPQHSTMLGTLYHQPRAASTGIRARSERAGGRIGTSRTLPARRLSNVHQDHVLDQIVGGGGIAEVAQAVGRTRGARSSEQLCFPPRGPRLGRGPASSASLEPVADRVRSPVMWPVCSGGGQATTASSSREHTKSATDSSRISPTHPALLQGECR